MGNNISLVPITLDQLKPLIYFAYCGDTDLREKYQADTSRTYEECVDFNFKEIEALISEENSSRDIFLWKITYHGTQVGYCVTIANDNAPGMLLSYSINKGYRKAIILMCWLQEVEKEIGIPYYTGLWTKNTRAISFFEKNGFTLLPASGREDYVYLVKNPELLDRKALLAASDIASD